MTRSIQITNASPFFEPPARCDLRVTTEGTPQSWAEEAARLLRPVFDFRKPTALMLGRYQPLHDGHKALIVEAIQRVGQACIAVRDTHGTDEKSPFSFEYVRAHIEHALRGYDGRYVVVLVLNITNFFYGRDVGYKIERIDLDRELQGHLGHPRALNAGRVMVSCEGAHPGKSGRLRAGLFWIRVDPIRVRRRRAAHPLQGRARPSLSAIARAATRLPSAERWMSRCQNKRA